MKKWILEHKKIYFAIVFGLALLLFGIITAVGCAKLERAEAAESFDYVAGYNLTYDVVSTIDTFVPNYYVVLDRTDYVTYLFFAKSPVVGGQNNIIWQDYGSVYEHFRVYKSDMRVERVNGGHVFSSFSEVSYCNFDIASSSGEVFVSKFELPEPEPEVTYSFSSDAPYLTFDTYSNHNSYILDDALLLSESSMSFNFTVVNNGMPVQDSYSADFMMSFYMPSKEWVASIYDLYLDFTKGDASALKTLRLYLKSDKVSSWYIGTEVSDAHHTVFQFPVTVDFEGNSYTLRFTYEDIINRIEEYYNFSLWEYYDIPQNIWEQVNGLSYYIYRYLFPSRVDAILYTKNLPEITYSQQHIWTIIPNFDIDKPVLYVVPGDPLFVGPMPPGDNGVGIQNAINQAYKDLLQAEKDKNQDLQNSIDGYLTGAGSFSDLNSSDMFGTFQSVSSGLMTMGTSVAHLAQVTGLVFGFMPAQVTYLMYFTLMVILICAIIKAIRG